MDKSSGRSTLLPPLAAYAAAAATLKSRLPSQQATSAFAASAHEASKGGSPLANVLNGAVLQMLEAATLGMPFEVRDPCMLWCPQCLIICLQHTQCLGGQNPLPQTDFGSRDPSLPTPPPA